MSVKAGQVLEAKEGFVCDINGERYIVNEKMTRIDSSHPLNQHYPQHFQPVADHLTYNVEAATAEPGEQRDREPGPPVSTPAPPEPASPATKSSEPTKSQRGKA